mmetsp:Transcript_62564/g.173411  ORF Transcript_62564/g.173411 Transcript_62564/m.173411 type:complete len:96 (-) Transcript_62564:1804-2091(-)
MQPDMYKRWGIPPNLAELVFLLIMDPRAHASAAFRSIWRFYRHMNTVTSIPKCADCRIMPCQLLGTSIAFRSSGSKCLPQITLDLLLVDPDVLCI